MYCAFGLIVRVVWIAALICAFSSSQAQVLSNNFVRGELLELNDNGAWSWFMDERLLVDRGRLIVGSVRASGSFSEATNPGWGNVELAVFDLATEQKRVVVLHEQFEQDDHNAPGLLVLADGRYLAAYTKHGQEPKIYYRISKRPHDPFEWEPAKVIVTPGNAGAFRGDSVTYCNPIRLSQENGRTYLFHRGVGLDPNYLVSEDDGRTWRYGGKVMVGRDGYSPYAKYASNGRDTVHIICTEDHPRNFDNSLYHGLIRDGKIHSSDGGIIGRLATSTNTPVRAWDLTPVYRGGRTNVAWMCDVELDSHEQPTVLFTVQVDGAGQPTGTAGVDHRFHYARWNGTAWNEQEIAFAGTRLYAGEDDYTGLGAIDPQDSSIVYISTDADPKSGRPLMSKATFRRQHELFRGATTDQGKTWRWTAVTANSSKDNLRPLVPKWQDERQVLVWMRGDYLLNRGEWQTKVVACVLPANDSWSGK